MKKQIEDTYFMPSFLSVNFSKLFFLFMCLSLQASAASFNFADISWGSRKSDVVKTLTAKGYSRTPNATINKNGDLLFEGKLVGENAQILAYFSGDSLAKIKVNLVTKDKDAIAVFRKMKNLLSKKYGVPSNDFEFFQNPYYDGDGYETQAIKLGKATFSSFWGTSLYLEITEVLTIHIHYESPEWSQEIDDRNRKAASDF
jgi:hypothetical protein